MSIPIDEINGLLNIVKEAAGHPAKLSSLGALAMKILEAHNATAKKEHDKLIADEDKEAAAKRQDQLNKQAELAKEEERKARLTSQPQPTAEQIAAEKKVTAEKEQAAAAAEAKRIAEAEELKRQQESQQVKIEDEEEPKADTYTQATEPVRRRETAEVE